MNIPAAEVKYAETSKVFKALYGYYGKSHGLLSPKELPKAFWNAFKDAVLALKEAFPAVLCLCLMPIGIPLAYLFTPVVNAFLAAKRTWMFKNRPFDMDARRASLLLREAPGVLENADDFRAQCDAAFPGCGFKTITTEDEE